MTSRKAAPVIVIDIFIDFVLHLLAPEEEAIASKACANKLFQFRLITILTHTAEKEEIPTLQTCIVYQLMKKDE